MLGMEFVDTDDIIEEGCKMPITRILVEMGEDHSRDLESGAVEKVCKLSRHVIAKGGGAAVRERNMK